MKLIIFIHTCKIYENSRAKLLENSWADDDNIIFITDNENCELKNYIYIGPYTNGPTYHPENVKKMFNLFKEKYNDYDYFMIVDDDTYLYVDKLKLFLSFFDKEQPYMIGDFLNWTNLYKDINNFGGNYDYWIGGGPGIVFTKSCLIEFMNLYNKYNIEYCNHDVWLHRLFNLSDGKIKRTHCPGFHQYNEGQMNNLSDKYLYKKFAIKDNNLISIHLNHDMSLISKYHENKQ
jgi:hypothetical protein